MSGGPFKHRMRCYPQDIPQTIRITIRHDRPTKVPMTAFPQRTKLRLLRQRDGTAPGTQRRAATVREENWGTPWGFGMYWDDHRKKNSLVFTEADLEYFEPVSALNDRPIVGPIRLAKSFPLPLVLLLTVVALYRGTEVVRTLLNSPRKMIDKASHRQWVKKVNMRLGRSIIRYGDRSREFSWECEASDP